MERFADLEWKEVPQRRNGQPSEYRELLDELLVSTQKSALIKLNRNIKIKSVYNNFKTILRKDINFNSRLNVIMRRDEVYLVKKKGSLLESEK